MPKVLKLNEISPIINKALDKSYVVSNKCDDPDAIILRSFNMHSYEMPKSVLCVARAGAGVNNIPIEECTKKGIVVFNTPGANANAVKEIVLCGLFMAARKISQGIKWTSSLKDKGAEVAKLVESGKSAFGGSEVLGKTLGVVGLGAIGAMVANAAVELGMKVIGFDPFISIDQAWNLSNNVARAEIIDELLAVSDFVSLNVPLLPATKYMVNQSLLEKMKDGVKIVNCARNELVNNQDMLAAIQSGKVSAYVTDFPSDDLIDIDNVVTIPHLGASTDEAEDNCAFMASKQMADYIQNGNITNSVNFSDCKIARSGKCRICVIHQNTKNVLNQITERISEQKINIATMASQSKGEFAYAIFDLDDDADDSFVQKLQTIKEVVRVRVIK